MNNDEIEMEVFRSGNYGAKGSYLNTDLDTIAADYRADLLEAPLTFDHAQAGPAYGWVSRLRREGDRLVAVLKGVPQAVRDMVRAGHYKRRSVELFRALPQTGRPYLRAVSLLGAATPEVKGLRDICFSANPDAECLQLAEPDTSAAAPDTPSDAEQLSALRAQLTDTKLTALFAELRADGYCLADRDAEAIRYLFAAYPDDAQAVAFSDGSRQETLAWMNGFLRSALLRAPLGEAAPHAAPTVSSAPGAHVAFGEGVDRRSVQLHQAAVHMQQESPGLSYRDALSRAAALHPASPQHI